MVALVLALTLTPVVAGLLWHKASDNPLWPALRSSLNWCDSREAQLAPDSPDGRYTAHIVSTVCFGRFAETMVFLTDRTDGLTLSTLNPNTAVLEVAGRRTLDAVVWIPAEGTLNGQPALHLSLVKGAQNEIHRVASRWRDVPILMGESKPAPGAERLSY